MGSLTILLIEDTQAIATQVCDYLEQQGVIVDYAATGKQGMQLAQTHHYDVILLDIMLPDIDGIHVCKFIKGLCDPVTPVLMLTARDSIQDKSTGFDAGADDYLTKPFELQELYMRCNALARRHQLHQSQQLCMGDLMLNENQRQVQRAGQSLQMSITDFNILLMLVKAYPNAVSRQQIINKIWGDDFPDSDVLRSHIYTLRQALDKPFSHVMLKTIHGLDFKLEA